MYYEITEETLIAQLAALKAAGIVAETVTNEEFIAATSPVLPPGRPKPCNDQD